MKKYFRSSITVLSIQIPFKTKTQLLFPILIYVLAIHGPDLHATEEDMKIEQIINNLDDNVSEETVEWLIIPLLDLLLEDEDLDSQVSQRKSISGPPWAFCSKDDFAFEDRYLSVPKPKENKICTLPASHNTGTASKANLIRCQNAKTVLCCKSSLEKMAKFPDGFGTNDVPSGAWFHIAGVTSDFPRARCDCP